MKNTNEIVSSSIAERNQAIIDNIAGNFIQDLEKGEGDRGGKVIGHTKSGKPIYEKFDLKTKKNHPYRNFTIEDRS